MKTTMHQFISRVRREARRKPAHVTLKAMGHTRVFLGYDWGGDTFVFEKDVWKSEDDHIPMLIVRKQGGCAVPEAPYSGTAIEGASVPLDAMPATWSLVPAKQ